MPQNWPFSSLLFLKRNKENNVYHEKTNPKKTYSKSFVSSSKVDLE